jgi:hypothetical protein
MAQVINENPGLGALFGTGLGNSLNLLAQHKMGQMLNRHQQAQTTRGLVALGIPEENAAQVATLPDKLQELVVKNYLSAAENAGLDNALSELTGGQPQQSMGEQFYQQAAPQQNTQLSALQNLLSSGQAVSPQAFSEQLSRQAQPQQAQIAQQPLAPIQKKQDFASLLRNPRLSPEQKLKIASLQQAKEFHKEKLSVKEQEEVNKETKPVYDEISKGAKAAQNNNKRLDRMEVLINEGKLTPAGWVGALENLGGVFGLVGGALGALAGGIPGAGLGGTLGGLLGTAASGAANALLSPESQEFKKLSNDFLKDAKETFGTRLTNYDVQTFLQTVPTLSQTDEGKRRVITNLRSFNEAAILRKNAMDKIIKANGGKRPANLDTLIEERIAPQLDILADKFKKGETIR